MGAVLEELMIQALILIWMFGALALWPIAKYLARGTQTSDRVLFWAFAVQFGLSVLWVGWLFIAWLIGIAHVHEGLIMLYLLGTLAWLVSGVAFVAWYLDFRQTRRARMANDRVT
jgi:hypothetical protein